MFEPAQRLAQVLGANWDGQLDLSRHTVAYLMLCSDSLLVEGLPSLQRSLPESMPGPIQARICDAF